MKALSRTAAALAAAVIVLSFCSCGRRLLGYSAMKLAGVETPQYWADKLCDAFSVSFDALPDEWDDGDVNLVGSGVSQSGDDSRGNFGYSVYRLRLPDSGEEMEKRISTSPVWRMLPDEVLAASLKQHEIKTFALFSGKELSPPERGFFCPVYYDDSGARYEIPAVDEQRSFVVGIWNADECELYYISVEYLNAATAESDAPAGSALS